MFPYIMILSALIFFDSRKVDHVFQQLRRAGRNVPVVSDRSSFAFATGRPLLSVVFAVFFAVQLLLPWRYLLNKGELFWTEEGYRFSWRVMLMEKMGYAQFVVTDKKSGERVAVNNNDFLTKNQEKMMATQPDFIIQYAHFLEEYYKKKGFHDPEVNATIYVTLNGRRSRLYADRNIDLAKQEDSFIHKNWLTSFSDNIYGL
jgi:hypothetical protein